MSARSFLVTIQNDTDVTWQLQHDQLDHGEWRDSPTGTIPPGGGGHFWAVSDGIATGVEGRVFYESGETIAIYFDNPFIGGNQFGASSNLDYRSRFRFGWGDPGGDDASITLSIYIPDIGLPGTGAVEKEIPQIQPPEL